MKRSFLRLAYIVTTVTMFAALAQSLERPAYGYVDPGSGMLLLQSIGSAVMGVLFVCRRRIAKILHFGSRSQAAAVPEHEEK